eukprot:scaffold36434_cov23-Cyclotella_meneghiniana.AAC.2
MAVIIYYPRWSDDQNKGYWASYEKRGGSHVAMVCVAGWSLVVCVCEINLSPRLAENEEIGK